MKLQPSICIADLVSPDIANGSLVTVNGVFGFCAKPVRGDRVLVFLNSEKSCFEFSAGVEGLTALSYGADLILRPDIGSFDAMLSIGQGSKTEVVSMGGKFGVIVHLPQRDIRFYDLESGELKPSSGSSVASGFKKWQLGIERGRDEFIPLMQSEG